MYQHRVWGGAVARLLGVLLLVSCGKTSSGAGSGGGGGTFVSVLDGSGGIPGGGGQPGTPAGAAGDSGGRGEGGTPADGGMTPPVLVPAFAEAARAYAAEYTTWGRVDDELRWAPFLCRIPSPALARASASTDSATHGQKLYSVFAKNHHAYPNGPQTDQVVVKQSWTAELVPGATYDPLAARVPADAGDHFYGYVQGDGGVYRAAAPAGLYIMFRLPPTTPDTDEGWVYATLTAAGEVTAAGRVASCMTCHEVATHERLFGVPTSVD